MIYIIKLDDYKHLFLNFNNVKTMNEYSLSAFGGFITVMF